MSPPQAREPAQVEAVSAKRRTLIAIPCFNEELAIGSIVLQARLHGDAVLVIDDGSEDRTSHVAREAGAELIIHPKNLGKGAGIREAFLYALDEGFDELVLMDGDGQHDPAEIAELLLPLRQKGADIALGFRFGNRTEMPLWRRFGKRVLDYATVAGGGGEVTDSQCGFRAFGRNAIAELAPRLRTDGFGIESEQLVHAAELRLRMENVPISCRYDGIDGSTKGPVSHALGVLATLVEVVALRRPLLTIGVPSITLLVTAVAMLIFTVQSYNATRVFSLGYALVTATLAIMGTFGAFAALILNLILVLEARLDKRRSK